MPAPLSPNFIDFVPAPIGPEHLERTLKRYQSILEDEAIRGNDRLRFFGSTVTSTLLRSFFSLYAPDSESPRLEVTREKMKYHDYQPALAPPPWPRETLEHAEAYSAWLADPLLNAENKLVLRSLIPNQRNGVDAHEFIVAGDMRTGRVFAFDDVLKYDYDPKDDECSGIGGLKGEEITSEGQLIHMASLWTRTSPALGKYRPIGPALAR